MKHDFGAPLKHKSGIDSWILLHPNERERLLLFIRIMGAFMAKMMAPLHNIQYTVAYKEFIKFNLGDY